MTSDLFMESDIKRWRDLALANADLPVLSSKKTPKSKQKQPVKPAVDLSKYIDSLNNAHHASIQQYCSYLDPQKLNSEHVKASKIRDGKVGFGLFIDQMEKLDVVALSSKNSAAGEIQYDVAIKKNAAGKKQFAPKIVAQKTAAGGDCTGLVSLQDSIKAELISNDIIEGTVYLGANQLIDQTHEKHSVALQNNLNRSAIKLIDEKQNLHSSYIPKSFFKSTTPTTTGPTKYSKILSLQFQMLEDSGADDIGLKKILLVQQLFATLIQKEFINHAPLLNQIKNEYDFTIALLLKGCSELEGLRDQLRKTIGTEGNDVLLKWEKSKVTELLSTVKRLKSENEQYDYGFDCRIRIEFDARLTVYKQFIEQNNDYKDKQDNGDEELGDSFQTNAEREKQIQKDEKHADTGVKKDEDEISIQLLREKIMLYLLKLTPV